MITIDQFTVATSVNQLANRAAMANRANAIAANRAARAGYPLSAVANALAASQLQSQRRAALANAVAHASLAQAGSPLTGGPATHGGTVNAAAISPLPVVSAAQTAVVSSAGHTTLTSNPTGQCRL